MAGFWGSVAGMLFVYYNLFLSPHALALQQSAEILLMAILGGASTLTGPIVGAAIITLVKNVVSTYVERWNTLLGAIFVHRHHVHAVRAGARLPAAVAAHPARGKPRGAPTRKAASEPSRMTAPALEVTGLNKRFGGLPATKNVSLTVMPGERRLIIGPNGAGKTTLFNLVTGDLTADSGSVKLFGQELLGMRDAATACISASPAPIRSSRCFRARRCCTTWCWRCSASTSCAGIPWAVLTGHRASLRPRARGAGAGRARRQRRARRRRDLLRRAAAARTRHGAGAEAQGAAARRAARRPVARRAPDRARRCSTPSRAT